MDTCEEPPIVSVVPTCSKDPQVPLWAPLEPVEKMGGPQLTVTK